MSRPLLRLGLLMSVISAVIISGVGPHGEGVAHGTSVIEQLGVDIDGTATDESFGTSVAINAEGTRIIAGAPDEYPRFIFPSGPNYENGSARIFDLVNGAWQEVASFTGESPGDYFGAAVAINADGDVVAIGAELNDGTSSDADDNRGHVRVFGWDGTTWAQLGADLDGARAGDSFGMSISLSDDGTWLAVGAPNNSGQNDTEPNIGSVWIYQWTGTQWRLDHTEYGDRPGDAFGRGVSMSANGTRVAIGAPNSSDGGTYSGQVKVLERSTSEWQLVGSSIPGAALEDYFGVSVSLSADGSRVAAGANGNDDGGTFAGHTRVFDWNGTQWTPVGRAIVGEGINDNSGDPVSLSADGSRLAIGARNNSANGTDSGHVRVFELSSGEWYQVGPDVDGVASGDQFGRSVALDATGSVLAAGAWGHDGARGHVRVFSVGALSLPTRVDDSRRSSANPLGSPGIFLTLEGETGQLVAQSSVVFGGYAIASSSAYLITVREEPARTSPQRVLSSGRATSAGHLEQRITLPALGPGTHTITLTAEGRNGELLVLGNRITVSASGTLQSVTLEQLQPTIR